MRRKVEVWLNQSTSFLIGYIPGDILHHVYTFEWLEGSDERDIAEEAYRLLNIEHPGDYKHRSLSVGDVVVTTDNNGSRHMFSVEPIGFREIFPVYVHTDLSEGKYYGPDQITCLNCEHGGATLEAAVPANMYYVGLMCNNCGYQIVSFGQFSDIRREDVQTR